MSLPDMNDMMAAENRRQEVAARGGNVSIRAIKAEKSIFKDLQIKFQENLYPMDVVREFSEKMAETKFPGYNWGATPKDTENLTPEPQHTEEEAIAEFERLQAESIANELQVTRTSTGQPKVDESGNVVPPIQSTTPEADADSQRYQKERERRKDAEDKAEERADKNSLNKPTQLPAQTVVVKESDKKDK